METIGLFQLENLILSRNPFIFLDVGMQTRKNPAPEPVGNYLRAAAKVAPDAVKAHLQELGVDKERPVLLISQDEVESAAVARDLEAAGFSNIYIVAGGVIGLLSEL